MSGSMRPQRRQPTRLPHPWDSLGKNTGVGCHFLLQCMKVESESEVAQSCPTLATPWTAAFQASPSMGFSRQEYWSGVPSPSPGLFATVQIKRKCRYKIYMKKMVPEKMWIWLQSHFSKISIYLKVLRLYAFLTSHLYHLIMKFARIWE